MVVLALTVVAIYGVFTGITGTRLLLLASRTRALPELTLGITYIVGGMLGWAALLFGGGIIDRAPTLGFWLNAVGLFCLSAGSTSLGLFCWRVFAPGSTALRVLFFAFVVTLIVDFIHNIVFLGIPFPPTSSFWYWPGMTARTALILWRPLSALPYYARLKRRLALGLADPVATNRVFLWGIAGALTAGVSLFVVAVTLAGLWETPARSVIAIITVVSAAVDAALSWLAFAPPRGYVEWVESRAKAGGI
jgi:hypothetical protein